MFIIEISQRNDANNRLPNFLEMQAHNLKELTFILENLSIDAKIAEDFDEFIGSCKDYLLEAKLSSEHGGDKTCTQETSLGVQVSNGNSELPGSNAISEIVKEIRNEIAIENKLIQDERLEDE